MKQKKNPEAAMLIEIGKLAGKKAREENFALGLPVVIEEDGFIIEVNKQGEKKRIKKVKNLLTINES